MRRAILGLLLIAGVAATAATPKLYTQETDHVRVLYYDPSHEYVVHYVIQCYENALKFERELLHYTPAEKVTILVDDFDDYGHGGAGTVPENFISLGMGPLNHAYETLPPNDRVSWIVSHELVHVITSDNSARRDRFFRTLFAGKVATMPEDPLSMLYSNLTSPRHYSPRWFHEGIATFLETWMSGGIGRGLGGFDEMVFRAMVRDGAYIYDAVGLESEGSSIDYQVGANAYLYGTRFMTWLCGEYGPEKLLAWVVRQDESKAYFASQFEKVYASPLPVEWRKWVSAEREWQSSNLKRIAAFPVTHVKPIATRPLGSVSRPYYDAETKRVYAAVRYPGAMAHLASIDLKTGRYDRLTDVQGAALYYVASLAFDPEGRRLFFTSENVHARTLNVFDLQSRRAQPLIQNYRAGELVYNRAAGGLWAVRTISGFTSLVLSQEPFRQIKPVYVFPYANEFWDMDISPDGTWLTGTMSDATGKQKLVKARIAGLLAGKFDFETVYDFGYNSPGNFVWSSDGKYLYGSSLYTGVSNLFRIDPAAPELEALSNSDTGMFRPLPIPDGRLIAMEYTAKGFLPGWADTRRLTDVNSTPYLGQATFEKHAIMREWKLSSPATIDPGAAISHTGGYNPAAHVQLNSIVPVAEGYKDTVAAGFRFDFADYLRIARASLTAAFSPDTTLPLRERFHGMLEMNLWSNKLSVTYNPTNFYDIFGPTKVSRRGWGVRLDHSKELIRGTSRKLTLNWDVAGYSGLDRLPDFQNIAVSHSRFLAAGAGLKYAHLYRTLGAVEDEAGTSWSVRSDAYFTGHNLFPQVQASWDHGMLLPLRNSSVWVRAAAGQAFGQSSDPFANFYFGAFGNNWVDHGSADRFRESYALPGAGLDAIGGTRFGRAQTEWDLPPKRFHRLGTPGAYLTWARIALFSTALATHSPAAASPGSTVADFGAQIDFRIVVRTYLETTLSSGYAATVDQHGRRTGGYMVSLKIQ